MGTETTKIALNAHVHLRTANQHMSRPERHVDDITDMRRSCWLRENTTGRRPLGSSSRLLKVPIDDDDEFRIFLEAMEEGIYNFNQRRSNWRFQRVDNLVINLADYDPTDGSSYIPLPEELSGKYL